MVRALKSEIGGGKKSLRKKMSTNRMSLEVKKLGAGGDKKQRTKVRLTKEKGVKNISLRITDKTVKEKKAVVVAIRKENVQLALLSPFRFPVPQEMMVGTVARYAGVFFVIAGAFFSLANLHFISTTYARTSTVDQFAQLVGGLFTDLTSSTLGGTTPTSSDGITGSTYTEPSVHISVSMPSPLKGSVPIYITVSTASSVTVLVENQLTKELIKLGSATKVDATTWTYTWNTELYVNNDYTLRVVISNAYGSYDFQDSTKYTVNNTTHSEGDIDTPTSTIELITDVVIAPLSASSEPSISLSTEEAFVHGEVYLEMSLSAKPLTVKIYARNVDTKVLSYIGYAKQKNDNTWYFNWDSSGVFDGSYTIEVKAEFENLTTASDSVSLAVDNIEDKIVVHEESKSTSIESIVENTDMALLEPDIDFVFSKASPLSGSVDINITTSEMLSVEVYAQQKNSLTPFFLGLAREEAPTEWVFSWATGETPNGEYDVYLRVKSIYGFTQGNKKEVKILNEVPTNFTKEEETVIDTLLSAKDSLIKTTDTVNTGTPAPSTLDAQYVLPQPVYIKPVASFVEAVDAEDTVKEEIDSLLTEFRSRLNDKLSELARAIRTNDDEALRNVKYDIEAIKEEIKGRVPAGIERKEIITDIYNYISEIALELENLTMQNETILKERIGGVVTADSDKDGISDYDEVNLYKTNPFVADTDGDSYIDSVEITLGYNPLNSSSEALVAYESPQETGVVREDLLVVNSITTLSPFFANEDEGMPVIPKAIISGTGLPNSFITLYIFSTPIVVTVKTDTDGGWSYIFDKELENGSHEMYVGITDNAGRVVAKSNPFAFVKTAEAFAGANTIIGAITAEEAEPALFGNNSMLLVASIAVVALGLVLILLGIHVKDRRLIEATTQIA